MSAEAIVLTRDRRSALKMTAQSDIMDLVFVSDDLNTLVRLNYEIRTGCVTLQNPFMVQLNREMRRSHFIPRGRIAHFTHEIGSFIANVLTQ